MPPYTRKQTKATLQALFDESDRGCILVGAAWIEDGLDKLLRAKFKKDSGIGNKELDKLLSYKEKNPVLASATARVRICEALGLFNRKTAKAIKSLLNYRNAAAHWRDELTVGPPKDRDAKEQLAEFLANTGTIAKLETAFTEAPEMAEWSGQWSERKQFVLSVVTLAYVLANITELITKAPSPNPRN